MSIRLRTIDGLRIAVCAAETDAQPGDLYLDDGDHYALAAKFAQDWHDRQVDWSYPEEWRLMETQKQRDAKIELKAWIGRRLPDGE